MVGIIHHIGDGSRQVLVEIITQLQSVAIDIPAVAAVGDPVAEVAILDRPESGVGTAINIVCGSAEFLVLAFQADHIAIGIVAFRLLVAKHRRAAIVVGTDIDPGIGIGSDLQAVAELAGQITVNLNNRVLEILFVRSGAV